MTSTTSPELPVNDNDRSAFLFAAASVVTFILFAAGVIAMAFDMIG